MTGKLPHVLSPTFQVFAVAHVRVSRGLMLVLIALLVGFGHGSAKATHEGPWPSDLKVSCWMKPRNDNYDPNPCYLVGDFDQDGRPDRAEQVVETSRVGGKGRKGIRVKFANGQQCVIGAGEEMTGGERDDKVDDLSSIDVWELARASDKYHPLPKRPVDGLKLINTEGGGYFVYWYQRKPRWIFIND